RKVRAFDILIEGGRKDIGAIRRCEIAKEHLLENDAFVMEVNHQVHVMARNQKVTKGVKRSSIESEKTSTVLRMTSEIADEPTQFNPTIIGSTEVGVPLEVIHAIDVHLRT